MGIAPAEGRAISYWEYSALVQMWNERHDPDGAQQPGPLPADSFVRHRQAWLAARGIAPPGDG